jgi:hypothetical protein
MNDYHNDPDLKARTLAQIDAHRAADELIRGTYWDGHRGCAVGCLTYDPNGGHHLFPERWGIPMIIARLMDGIFENLPQDLVLDWPHRIMEAIPVGADLKNVQAVANLYQRQINGDNPSRKEWQDAARAAAYAAYAARVRQANKLVELCQAAPVAVAA